MKNIILLIICILLNSIILAQNYGSWTEIDSLNIARVGHAMVVLQNGNVLVSGSEVDSIQSSCEIYDISTGKWRYTTPMNVPRALHNLVLLKTGKVLAIGGFQERSCELFHPITETWTMTDSIPIYGYHGQTVTSLNDGKIMVVGGMYVDTTSWELIILNKAEIYDPDVGIWAETAPMNLGRYEHTATLLKDGRVLIAGGETDDLTTDHCEIYDPLLNAWEIIPQMNEKRSQHAAILLNSGNVFLSGGGNVAPLLISCEVYDVKSNEWLSVADMLLYRIDHQIYYLASIDKLLILGGGVLDFGEDTWEIYDPNSLQPLYLEPFPINQFLVDNNVQLLNEYLLVAGGLEYRFTPLPVFSPSKRSWIFDVVSNVAQVNETIEEFYLFQNYPNPFNPTTTISYILESYAKVELIVYDVLGNEIETLVNKSQPSGTYHIKFDASGFSSGIYYYRLNISNDGLSAGKTFQQTKKMILIR